MFFVTHDIEEALILADRVLLVREGGSSKTSRSPAPAPGRGRPRNAEAVALTKRILTHLGVTSRSARFQPVEAAQQ